MIENMAALLLAIYGGYLFYTGQVGDGLTPMDLVKSGGSVATGVGYLVYNNWASLRGLVGNIKGKVNTVVDAKTEEDVVFTPKSFEQRDFECLVHLRNRVVQAKSDEGIKVCAELNRIIFELNTGKN